jgi:hypothetical protein
MLNCLSVPMLYVFSTVELVVVQDGKSLLPVIS